MYTVYNKELLLILISKLLLIAKHVQEKKNCT